MHTNDTVVVWETDCAFAYSWAGACNPHNAMAVAGVPATPYFAVVAAGVGGSQGCCEHEESDEMFLGIRIYWCEFCAALLELPCLKGKVKSVAHTQSKAVGRVTN